MPAWSEIVREIDTALKRKCPAPHDFVRRQYLNKLHSHTGRDIILYASGWIQHPKATPEAVSIVEEDIQAFMEVNHGLRGNQLDLILHSPGGSPEIAQAIVSYLRDRYSHIRVIVPTLAMSAATMIACSADEIVLGKHSFLGPTDPQLLLPTPLGMRMASAQEILEQFYMAQRECADPKKLSAWLSMLNQYGPDLLVRCKTAVEMSRNLVENWLKNYMFKGEDNSSAKAKSIADWLTNCRNFMSHSQHINRQEIDSKGLKTIHLEDDSKLQDLSLSVFHATMRVFEESACVKIVENHAGRAFIKHQVSVAVAPPTQQRPQPPDKEQQR